MRTTIRRLAVGIVAALVVNPAPSAVAQDAAGPEYLCLKNLDGPHQELAIACYSEKGCTFVEKLGAETLPDYDLESVAAALGREKIEGIVTSSDAIMKKIKGYGYKCKPAE